MTEAARPARRKRPHAAAGARVVVVGAATAGTLALVGLMAEPAAEAGAEPVATPTTVPSAVEAAPPVPARIVVVRRHHPAPAGTLASAPAAGPAPAAGRSAAAASPTPPPPAPAAPAPAPRPAAPTTISGGS